MLIWSNSYQLNVLTHHWCHFLEILSRTDCWRFSVESPANKKFRCFFFSDFFSHGDKTKQKSYVVTRSKRAQVNSLSLTHLRRSEWLLFLKFKALIVGLNLMLDRRIESINQANAWKSLRWLFLWNWSENCVLAWCTLSKVGIHQIFCYWEMEHADHLCFDMLNEHKSYKMAFLTQTIRKNLLKCGARAETTDEK